MNHIGDTNKMVSDTPRTDAAIGNSQDRSWMDGTLCRQLERELNAANERTKRLEEAGDALMEIVEGARSERWHEYYDNKEGWEHTASLNACGALQYIIDAKPAERKRYIKSLTEKP